MTRCTAVGVGTESPHDLPAIAKHKKKEKENDHKSNVLVGIKQPPPTGALTLTNKKWEHDLQAPEKHTRPVEEAQSSRRTENLNLCSSLIVSDT